MVLTPVCKTCRDTRYNLYSHSSCSGCLDNICALRESVASGITVLSVTWYRCLSGSGRPSPAVTCTCLAWPVGPVRSVRPVCPVGRSVRLSVRTGRSVGRVRVRSGPVLSGSGPVRSCLVGRFVGPVCLSVCPVWSWSWSWFLVLSCLSLSVCR